MAREMGTPAKALWVCLGVFVGLLAFMAACAIGLSGQSGNVGVSVEVRQKYAIETCQSALMKRMRDPESAKFADEVAREGVAHGGGRDPELDYSPDRGDIYFTVTGNVNAKNAFGGYTGMRPYTCDAVVGRNGTTQSRARVLD
nr:hypothetical protein [Mycobacteroides abscessus]